MGSVDLRDVDWVLTNRSTEWHREHYLCSTTHGFVVIKILPYGPSQIPPDFVIKSQPIDIAEIIS